MIYRRIFKCNQWESVKLFIFGLGHRDHIDLRATACLKFVKLMSLLNNSVLMRMSNMFN